MSISIGQMAKNICLSELKLEGEQLAECMQSVIACKNKDTEKEKECVKLQRDVFSPKLTDDPEVKAKLDEVRKLNPERAQNLAEIIGRSPLSEKTFVLEGLSKVIAGLKNEPKAKTLLDDPEVKAKLEELRKLDSARAQKLEKVIGGLPLSEKPFVLERLDSIIAGLKNEPKADEFADPDAPAEPPSEEYEIKQTNQQMDAAIAKLQKAMAACDKLPKEAVKACKEEYNDMIRQLEEERRSKISEIREKWKRQTSKSACGDLSDGIMRIKCLKNTGVISTAVPHIMFNIFGGYRKLDASGGSSEPPVAAGLGMGFGLDYNPASPLILGINLVYEWGGWEYNFSENALTAHTIRAGGCGGYKFRDVAILGAVEYMHHWYKSEPSGSPGSGSGLAPFVQLRFGRIWGEKGGDVFGFLDVGREFSLSDGLYGWFGRLGVAFYTF